MDKNREVYDTAIPGFSSSVTKAEFDKYIGLAKSELGESYNHAANTQDFTHAFWVSKAESLPELYKLYSLYKNLSTTSADTERSFSKLNNLLSNKRMSLTEQTIQQLAFLN